MWIIYFLVGVSFLMALAFLGAFFWAHQDGQWEDTYTPSVRVLFDDKVEPSAKADTKN